MSAAIRKLPYEHWFYNAIIPGPEQDPAASDLFIWQQALRDLPEDAANKVRAETVLACIEALFPYIGVGVPAELADDPVTRRQQLARVIPIRRIPWPSSLGPELFDWAKGVALEDTVVSEILQTVPRIEGVPGSREMHHRTRDGRPIKPLIDIVPAALKKRLQGGMYRRLKEWVVPEHEAQAAYKFGATAESIFGDDGVACEFGPYSRTSAGTYTQQRTTADIGIAAPSPRGSAPVISNDWRRELRARAIDIRLAATPTQLKFIQASLGAGRRLLSAPESR